MDRDRRPNTRYNPRRTLDCRPRPQHLHHASENDHSMVVAKNRTTYTG
jgi:hypothetical protein